MSSQKNRKKDNRSDQLEIPLVSDTSGRSILMLFICLAGLIVSLTSGFQEQVPGLKFLCSSACKDTAEIHFLHVPIWLWGAVFYSIGAVLALFRREMAPWIAAPAAGVEAVLILLMIQLKEPCTFCIANAAVVLLLLAVALRKELFWQETTLALLFFVGLFVWVPFENGLSLPAGATASSKRGADPADSGIAAMVGSDVITNQRLDVLLGGRLLETQKDIYRMKIEKLDQLIGEILLDKEAKQQGKTPETLVEQIAPAESIPAVEETEVDKYIEENKQRLQVYQGSIPDLRERIKAFLAQQKRSQIITAYIHTLEPKYAVRILLPMPNPPKVKVDTQGAPTLGPSDAPVTIVEFSDYQCPACRATHQIVKEVRAAYGDKVQWIYKEYPLKRHKDAFVAAEASHCAEDQGKFWEYQEVLFTAADLTPESLINLAGQLGMSRDKFSQCLQDSRYKALVEKNVRDATQAGLDRTPTFMINGTVFTGGPSLDTFKNMIDEELRKAGPQRQTVGKAQ
jgi:protein-disulfide isomerase